jgi:hypothetical protein
LTAVAVVLALAVAGCGKDDPTAGPAAGAAAVTTTATAATAATTATTPKASTAKKAHKASSAAPAKAAAAKKAKKAASKPAAAKTTAAAAPKKQKTTAKKAKTPPAIPGVTPKPTPAADAPAADLSSGTGSGPTADRLAVVAALRRYYKAFVDVDGATVCGLLTSEGRDAMIIDGGAKTCVGSVKALMSHASADDTKLLQDTRDGLHIDDITIAGKDATAQIGKTSQLRLVQENGAWLVRSPNVVQSKS